LGIRFQNKIEMKSRRRRWVGWMLFVLCVAPPCFEQVQAQGSSDTSALAATGPAPAPDANATSSQQALAPLDSADPSPIAPTPIAPAPAATAASAGFWSRFAKAYYDDWHADPNGGEPMPHRGFPPPEENPPYPFNVWPIGGTVWIGYPNATAYPLWTALSTGPHGDWWKEENIQIYGWADVGLNFSTSNGSSGGKYANAPAAYNQIPNSIQLDQLVTYIERVPDTIQTDHFDWGFRFTGLYGLDYRFTTAKGYFSQQLLTPQPDGTVGKQYGFDPVMAYVDLYFPHVGEGMDLRIGRYVSLPDIEAQLAPNNYTYTHSLTYTYDCYTQTGVNATIKVSDHWTLQFGVSPGCDTAIWKSDAKLTFNTCVAYNWHMGEDNVYFCANSLNNGRYAYNNLAAYYATWYHKFNSKWHTATESWYQYESHTPNIFNPVGQTLIETNANGAWCASPTQVTCYAPEWTVLNYTLRQLTHRDFIALRNEFFDDIRGQRTGYKDHYLESGISWNHWIGSTIVMRPELRWEHAFENPAYDGGNRHSQFMFAADLIWFY
jgi:Putative beta-barrel porin-2, OmpL-like. bbp2